MFVCEGKTVGKIGEVDEKGERELVLVVSVRERQGMGHDTWMTFSFFKTQRCAFLSFAAPEP